MPYALILQFIVTLTSLCLLVLAVVKRGIPKSLWFCFLALALFFYALGTLFELGATGLATALLACRVAYLGIPLIGPLFLLFACDYYDHPIKNRLLMAALFVLPLAATALVYAWPQQTLYYQNLEFITGPTAHLQVTPGPFYYLYGVYNYGLVAVGAAVSIRAAVTAAKGSRRSYTVLLPLASLLPAVVALAYALGLVPGGVDPTSAALTVTLLAFAIYTLRYRAVDWMPLARESILERISDAYILLDPGGIFLDANAVAYEYFPSLKGAAGRPAEEIPGFPLQLLLPGTAGQEFTVQKGEEELHLRTSSTPIRHNGKTVCTSILIYDITEMHHLMEELHELATHDTLTGLYNRGTFFNFASRDFELALRNGDVASVMMLDIDFFKLVNDRYGHQMGDEVLIAIADTLRGRLRRTDIIGRYGGEEILVYLPGASHEGALMIAEVIRRTIEQKKFRHKSVDFNITVSIGVATINPQRHHTIEDLVLEADTAMYKAKTTGRNKVVAA